ncbi:MAG TPA: hypothetical protein VN796_01955 [Acidimicrobiales bacterium]|nr:hypothetical protein [Acidimicrobiales bacterium]
MDEGQGTDVVATAEDSSAPVFAVGTKVSVRSRYLGQWSGGFEVAEVMDDGYRIRRLSDDHAFPDVFLFEDVRWERRRQPERGIGSSYLDRRA